MKAHGEAYGTRVRSAHHQSVKEGYIEWFSRFTWDWFVALTFEGRPSRARAEEKFLYWIAVLQQSRGSETFGYVRVKEFGANGDNLHFHLLIGGLKKGTSKKKWAAVWGRIAGQACVRDYDPRQNGIAYLLKTATDPGFDLDIQLKYTGER